MKILSGLNNFHDIGHLKVVLLNGKQKILTQPYLQ